MVSFTSNTQNAQTSNAEAAQPATTNRGTDSSPDDVLKYLSAAFAENNEGKQVFVKQVNQALGILNSPNGAVAHELYTSLSANDEGRTIIYDYIVDAGSLWFNESDKVDEYIKMASDMNKVVTESIASSLTSALNLKPIEAVAIEIQVALDLSNETMQLVNTSLTKALDANNGNKLAANYLDAAEEAADGQRLDAKVLGLDDSALDGEESDHQSSMSGNAVLFACLGCAMVAVAAVCAVVVVTRHRRRNRVTTQASSVR